MLDVAKLRERAKNIFKGDARTRIIVILGLIGMVLILVSQFTGGGGSAAKSKIPDTQTAEFTSEMYIRDLEAKLQSLITGMEGVGKARVMITLQNGAEKVYAQEEKRNIDKTQEATDAQTVGKIYQKENVEQKYILVDSEYGKKEALVLTQLEPKIQGVVIVCEGAGNIRVEADLTNVVTTALNIPSTRVCVVKISD